MLEEEAEKRRRILISQSRRNEIVEKLPPSKTDKSAVQAGKMFGVKNLFHFQF